MLKNKGFAAFSILLVLLFSHSQRAHADPVTKECTNVILMDITNRPSIPPAYYVGDTVRLAVNQPADFSYQIDGFSTPISQNSYQESVVLGGPYSSFSLTAFAFVNLTNVNCKIISVPVFRVPQLSTSIPTQGATVTNLSFSAAATFGGGGFTYLWDFGDGTTSTSSSTTHSYNSAGTYTVEVTATDRYGRSERVTETIAITDNPNVPLAPRRLRTEYIGCGSGTAEYIFDWLPGGGQPSNYYQFQYKPRNGNNWGYTYTGTQNSRVISNLLQSFSYEWRVRGCTSSSSSTCGPWTNKSLRTQSCSAGGGTVPF